MSELLTVRIPRALKEKMKKYNVNWSEVVRRSIERKIRELDRAERAKRASLTMDALRKRLLERFGETDYDSAEAIRKWREARR